MHKLYIRANLITVLLIFGLRIAAEYPNAIWIVRMLFMMTIGWIMQYPHAMADLKNV